MSPLDLAQQRIAAIEALQQQLAAATDAAARELYERLLAQLTDIHADPSLLPAILAEYQAATLVPLAYTYAQALLTLPALNVAYFEALDVAGYQALRAPLSSYLAGRLGVDAAGNAIGGGYLAALAGDTTVARQVLSYAYGAQASGVGLNAYRDGLNALVLGNGPGAANGLGVVQQLYRESSDDFNRADRALQQVARQELGLRAAIYQGGLIASSRPFCVARNGKCFVDFEIARFGSSKDAYGGYTNKKQGLFSGKSDPYTPEVDLGGYGCRHGLHYVPNVIALRMRADLGEKESGELFIK